MGLLLGSSNVWNSNREDVGEGKERKGNGEKEDS